MVIHTTPGYECICEWQLTQAEFRMVVRDVIFVLGGGNSMCRKNRMWKIPGMRDSG